MKKNNDQEIRHENNIVKLNEENEKIAKENEERDFKKYCAFYWKRKSNEEENKKRKKENNKKQKEKVERLMEIEKLNEKRRNNILQKIKTMDIKKGNLEKNKYEKILERKQLREQRFTSCLAKRKDMLIEEDERRKRQIWGSGHESDKLYTR